MTKWADFIVTEVKYNSKNTHIEEIKCSTHNDTSKELKYFGIKHKNRVIE